MQYCDCNCAKVHTSAQRCIHVYTVYTIYTYTVPYTYSYPHYTYIHRCSACHLSVHTAHIACSLHSAHIQCMHGIHTVHAARGKLHCSPNLTVSYSALSMLCSLNCRISSSSSSFKSAFAILPSLAVIAVFPHQRQSGPTFDTISICCTLRVLGIALECLGCFFLFFLDHFYS